MQAATPVPRVVERKRRVLRLEYGPDFHGKLEFDPEMSVIGERNPRRGAVYGAVEDDSTDRLIDLAHGAHGFGK